MIIAAERKMGLLLYGGEESAEAIKLEQLSFPEPAQVGDQGEPHICWWSLTRTELGPFSGVPVQLE